MRKWRERIKGKTLMDFIMFGPEYIKMLLEKSRLSRTQLVEIGVTQKKREIPIIVSLTSFPARINFVDKCIKTILNQTLKPDRVILWLAFEQFPNKELDIPSQLLELKKYGLEICWCRDLKSYKKLVPVYENPKFRNCIIVTADDDQYYDRNWLELLYKGYKSHPECISCHRATKVVKDISGHWKLVPGRRQFYSYPSYLNKLVGCGGVLYPPHCLYPDVVREELFTKLTPTNDDIWFWIMGILNNYKVNVVANRIIWSKEFGATRKTALSANFNEYHTVMTQFRSIINCYPEAKQKIAEELFNTSNT